MSRARPDVTVLLAPGSLTIARLLAIVDAARSDGCCP
jgi:hypothetical protein